MSARSDLFPVRTARDVVRIFEHELDALDDDESSCFKNSLARLSILLGLIESQLTSSSLLSPLDQEEGNRKGSEQEGIPKNERNFSLPVPISHKRIKVLLDQFSSLIKGSVDLSSLPANDNFYERLVARTADVIWTLLAPSNSSSHHGAKSSSSNTDQLMNNNNNSNSGHLQFLPSFLLDKRLDSFGLTFAVLSAIQILAPNAIGKHVFLTLSEDHSWISVIEEKGANHHHDEHGLAGKVKRVEVTWHGKVDKRQQQQQVTTSNNNNNIRNNFNSDLWIHSSNSYHHHHSNSSPSLNSGAKKDNWLYLGEVNALICDSMHVTLATLVSSLNSALSLTADSLPLALIKRDLLALFHSRGLLNKYPMAIGNLADLIEVIHPELVLLPRLHPLVSHVQSLYHESISSGMTHYADGHIYPYLYLAGFYIRSGEYSGALSTWSRASRSVSRYNYVVKEDEEAYREFQEIATDLIPFCLKQLHEQVQVNDDDDESSKQDERQEDQDWKRATGLRPAHYRDLVQFYDGICGWEESSRCPILHIVWAKSFISSLNKFHPRILSSVKVQVEGKEGDDDQEDERQDQEAPKVDLKDLVSKCSSDPSFLLNLEGEEGKQTDQDEIEGKKNEDQEEVVIKLRSAKMGEMAQLLVLGASSSSNSRHKLNTSAIQLQLTAQSSLLTERDHHVRSSSLGATTRTRSSSTGSNGAKKRTRRGSGAKNIKKARDDSNGGDQDIYEEEEEEGEGEIVKGKIIGGDHDES